VGRHTDPALAQRRATVLTIVVSALLVAGGLLALKISIDEGLPRPTPPTPTRSTDAEVGQPPPTGTGASSPSTTTGPPTTGPPTAEATPSAVVVGARAGGGSTDGSSTVTAHPVSTVNGPASTRGEPLSRGRAVQEVIRLVDAAHVDAGCAPLRRDPHLQRAAKEHSADMARRDYLSHTSLDGRSFAERIRDAGYDGSPLGENLAAGQASARDVVAAWLDSAPHRAALLDCSYTRVGVGLGTGGTYGRYWTLDLGG
jgi:uncharacterized protein YkwD